jgi:hypothetical protein
MSDKPIACSLSAADLERRRARWEALADGALIERAQRLEGVRLVYRAEPGAEQELRELVALEAECCPFLDFSVTPQDGRLVLDVTGPEAAANLF